MSSREYLPPGAGPCAKACVRATLVLSNGEHLESTNFCMKPQRACPREQQGYGAGEGYHLCKEVCEQPAHAEVNVLTYAENSGRNLKGSALYVNYTWICPACWAEAKKRGVPLFLGRPEDE